MPALTLTSEVDAVNVMLRAVSEAPVSTIAVGTLTADIQMAVDTLRDTSRKVQARGWDFNSEEEVTLSLDTDGYAVIGTNVLKCDTSQREHDIEVVLRGTRLYDKQNHTYVFERAPVCDVVYLLPWEEIPEVARQYIAVKAARIYQQACPASPTLANFTERDELMALAAMNEDESESQDGNIFDSWDMASIINRRRPMPS